MSETKRKFGPWEMTECDECGAEYQVSRTRPVELERCLCGDCEIYEKAVLETAQRYEQKVADLQQQLEAKLTESTTLSQAIDAITILANHRSETINKLLADTRALEQKNEDLENQLLEIGERQE